MLTGESRASLTLMPVVALFDWLHSLRRVDARRRRDAFFERLTAARGDKEGVDKVAAALSQAAGEEYRSARAGDVNDFQRWLSGGGE